MFFKNYVSPDNKLENIDFKNPFTNETVDSINIEIRKPWFDGDKPVKANVWFRNKNTSGI